MKITRRDFIKSSLVLGGSLLLPRKILSASSRQRQGWHPAYAKLESEGRLAPRIEQAYFLLQECELCPRQCGANRLAGERGFCRAITAQEYLEAMDWAAMEGLTNLDPRSVVLYKFYARKQNWQSLIP